MTKARLQTGQLINSLTLATVGSLVALSVTMPKAVAITINRNFIEQGTLFDVGDNSMVGLSMAEGTLEAPLSIEPTFMGGEAPENTAGGGNLIDIFNAAADWWEMAIQDDFESTIDFAWAPLGGGTLGLTTVPVTPVPPVQATIQFDNDGSTDWFLDSTPHQNEEYNNFNSTFADLGGGRVNTGRVYNDATGDAFGRFDLLSVAKHEIGHALGFINIGNFTTPSFTVTDPRPNAGTVISTTAEGGGHTDPDVLPNTLMEPFSTRGERKLQSGVDILGVAELGGFTQVNLNPVHKVPEPTATPLALGLAMGVGAFLTRKSSKKRSQ